MASNLRTSFSPYRFEHDCLLFVILMISKLSSDLSEISASYKELLGFLKALWSSWKSLLWSHDGPTALPGSSARAVTHLCQAQAVLMTTPQAVLMTMPKGLHLLGAQGIVTSGILESWRSSTWATVFEQNGKVHLFWYWGFPNLFCLGWHEEVGCYLYREHLNSSPVSASDSKFLLIAPWEIVSDVLSIWTPANRMGDLDS